MKVKQSPNEYPRWNGPPVQEIDGIELLQYAMKNDNTPSDNVRSLMRILGRLIDELPEEKRLEVTGLMYNLEYVPSERNYIGKPK